MELAYQEKMKKYDEKITQIHSEFFAFFDFFVYIYRQVFFGFFDFFSDSPFFKRRITRIYDRRVIKSQVSPILVKEFGEKNENNEKYTSHDFIKDIEQIKKPLNKFFKIVIFKKKDVRKYFKKMKLILKQKKNSKKSFVGFFINSTVFFEIVKFSFKKRIYEFEKNRKK